MPFRTYMYVHVIGDHYPLHCPIYHWDWKKTLLDMNIVPLDMNITSYLNYGIFSFLGDFPIAIFSCTLSNTSSLSIRFLSNMA